MMRSEVTIEAELRQGRTVYPRLRSNPPISLRRTPDAVRLVSSGAGPLGGDELGVRISIGEGADAVVRSVASSMVLPGARPATSRSWLDVTVGAGASLDLGLEPQIITGGADHESRATVRLAAGATLRWEEVTVLGRHREEAGSLLQRVRVELDGRPLLVQDLAVGPRWPGSTGPGGIAGARAVGSCLVVGGGPPADPGPVHGVRGAVLPLADGAWLATATSSSASALTRWLAAATEGRALLHR